MRITEAGDILAETATGAALHSVHQGSRAAGPSLVAAARPS
ncbi:MAG TPA: hypothetical protein VMV12_06630 [Candidatus Micrarchaeaceae archaeon]|nr:hypothetical protein [Candidatus Micrarchaeaceae archaeon]